jgi:signal peptidase I
MEDYHLINKPRKPWISGIFTVFSFGLGHIYTGEAKRGIILFFIGQVLSVISYPLVLLPVIPINLVAVIFIIFAFYVYCVVDAVRLSRKSKFSYNLKKYNKWYVYLLFGLITTFVIQPINGFVIKKNIVQAYKIPSRAMEPTLLAGDHIFVNKLTYNKAQPTHGDIIVFKFPIDPKKDFIKRIVGVAGDEVEIRNKEVFVNNIKADSRFAQFTDSFIVPKCPPGHREDAPCRKDNFGPIKVPKNQLFLMGDNRDQSFDSRFWGFVDLEVVSGKAYWIYWSWDKDKSIIRWDRIGKKIE